MKKIYCFAMLVLVSLFMNMQITIVEAADYYLGTYEDGREAYLMEDDIEIFQMYAENGAPIGKEFQCTVKAIKSDQASDYEYVFYSVFCSQFLGMQKDGEQLYNRKNQREFFATHIVEKTLADYIAKLYESKFGPGGW